jgi:hypothetical protein
VDYQKPMVIDYGEITALTAAASTGSQLDASFPTHTPFTQLTFT